MSVWNLRADPQSTEIIETWLKEEAIEGYVINVKPEVVQIDFSSIDDAFRFRLQFDEVLVD